MTDRALVEAAKKDPARFAALYEAYFGRIVDDCDAVYQDALRAGATSVTAPEDKPYGERQATVADPFGNLWFVATALGA